MEGEWFIIGCMFDLGVDFGACDFNVEHSGEKGLATPSKGHGDKDALTFEWCHVTTLSMYGNEGLDKIQAIKIN
jgi:hypothetical protein